MVCCLVLVCFFFPLALEKELYQIVKLDRLIFMFFLSLLKFMKVILRGFLLAISVSHCLTSAKIG